MFGREHTTRALHRRTEPNRLRYWGLLAYLGTAAGASGAASAGTASAGAGAAGAEAGAAAGAGAGLSSLASTAAPTAGGVASGLGANMTAAPAAGSFMASPGMMYGGGATAAGPSMWDVVNHLVSTYGQQGPMSQIAPDFTARHPYYAGAANAVMAPGGGGGVPPQAAPPPPAMGRDPRQLMAMIAQMGGSPSTPRFFGAAPSILSTTLGKMVPAY